MALTTYTIQIQKFFNLLAIEEERYHNSLDAIELHNGKTLTRGEQVRFFIETYGKMVDSGSFNDDSLDIFTDMYENGEFYNAWSFLLGIIDDLSLWNIATWLDLPKQITIGTDFYDFSNKRFQSTYKRGVQDGFLIAYNKDGSVHMALSQSMGIQQGQCDLYGEGNELLSCKIYKDDYEVFISYFA